MAELFAEITTSLDGFVAGPDAGVSHPLGRGGERLHEWVFGLASWRRLHGEEGGVEGPESDQLMETFARTGAVVMGRTMYDCGEGPWGEEPPFRKPVFVVTHRAHPELAKKGGTTFHFVTGGVAEAVSRARAAAGEQDIQLAGGADVIRQAIAQDLLDELTLHIAPVLIGSGTRLFDGPADERHIEWRTTRVSGSTGDNGTTHVTLRRAR